MTPFAVPLTNPAAVGIPPPPPEAFLVAVGTYVSDVSGANGSALTFRAYPANGQGPYSFTWAKLPYSSPKANLGAQSDDGIQVGWSGLDVGETAPIAVQVACYESGGQVAFNTAVAYLKRVS